MNYWLSPATAVNILVMRNTVDEGPLPDNVAKAVNVYQMWQKSITNPMVSCMQGDLFHWLSKSDEGLHKKYQRKCTCFPFHLLVKYQYILRLSIAVEESTVSVWLRMFIDKMDFVFW